MYILASDLFRKDGKYVFRARYYYCVWRKFLAFKYVSINLMIIYICTSEILITRFLNRFFDTQYPLNICGINLNLCGQVYILNGYWIVEKQVLYTRKYLRFLMYKLNLELNLYSCLKFISSFCFQLGVF